MYLGGDAEAMPTPVSLLRGACAMASGFLDARYGIAYISRLADEPDCYAAGVPKYTLAQIKRFLDAEGTDNYQRSPIEKWKAELRGERRHLQGLFRGAYATNVLSQSHVSRADLPAQRLGQLSALDSSLWLWELTDAEIPVAQQLLRDRNALVS